MRTWRGLGAAAAMILLSLGHGCAVAYSLRNEFMFPNLAEGPMNRPPPPGAIQHRLETPDGAPVELTPLAAWRVGDGSGRHLLPWQFRFYRERRTRISRTLHRARLCVSDG